MHDKRIGGHLATHQKYLIHYIWPPPLPSHKLKLLYKHAGPLYRLQDYTHINVIGINTWASMVSSCCVKGCSEKFVKGGGVSYFRISSKPEMQRNAWISALKRNGWTPKPHHRICSRHFVTGRQWLFHSEFLWLSKVCSFGSGLILWELFVLVLLLWLACCFDACMT